MSDKLRCISMDIDGGEPEGIIWAEAEDKKLDHEWFGDRLCSYLYELEDLDQITITFYRKDMTRQQIDALPEL